MKASLYGMVAIGALIAGTQPVLAQQAALPPSQPPQPVGAPQTQGTQVAAPAAPVAGNVSTSPAAVAAPQDAVPPTTPTGVGTTATGPEETVPGDIIVTAQRRESTVREVPFSIAAFGGEQLRTQQIFSPAALTQTVPGITINTSDKSLSIVAIRGNVSTFRSATIDTPVAFFVDDVYYVNNNDLNSNFYDVSRVEVLRGPQGTLFGRNVVGGAIAVVTNNPTFATDASLALSGGNGAYFRSEGMVNGVLIADKLAARVAFSTERTDGLIDAPHQQDNFGASDNRSIRAKLLFTPTDTLKFVLSGDYSNTTGNGGAVQLMVGGSQPIPATFGPYIQADWVNNDYAPNPITQRLRGTYLRGDLDLFGGTLTSITGYRLNDSYSLLDNIPTATVTPVFGLTQTVRERSFTQEVRYASAPRRLSYVVGAYYLHANVTTNNNFDYSPLPGSAVGAAIPPNPAITNIDRIQAGHITSFAFFGEATLNITDRFALVAGGRYSNDDKSIDYLAYSRTNPGVPIAAFGFPGTVTASGGTTFDAFTPRFTAKWKPVDAVNLYATYAKGFKSGGFVDNAYLNPTIPLQPEKATNIEIGAKTRVLDNRLDFNVSLFHQETKNLQNFSGAGGIAHTYNGSEVAQGAEVESVLRVTRDLRFNVNYSHITGHYTSLHDPLAVGADYSGNPIKYTPKDAFTVGGSYTQHLRTAGALTFQSDFSYSSRTHTDDANTLPLYQNIYDATRGRTLNSRLTYDSANGKWSFGLWVKNLTDHYQVSVADDITTFLVRSGGNHYWKVFTNQPRSFGATVSIRR